VTDHATTHQEAAWEALLTLRHGDSPAAAYLCQNDQGYWQPAAHLEPALSRFLQLYLPLLQPREKRSLVLAHLGQSLDGRIATDNGVSQTINGPENITHLHRLRALSDAVLVGAGTVHFDNPQLTTRRVRGDNPARVILDPTGRCDPDLGIFTDGAAPTLLCCRHECVQDYPEGVELLPLPTDASGRLSLSALLEALSQRGLVTLFVEGGGVTVSAFLQAEMLDILQLTVAPIIIGSGRPSIRLPTVTDLEHICRPQVTTYPMGDDMLFHCQLRETAP